ncbi:NTF2 fold immunity protein [Desulfatibacillum aliphaticivorans]|uniref:NTF2 fold immunity protein n=1 Tax=Desulfatibacillum aliphaticivorans TaxID=218208 RepID=UPI0006864C92|nr:NTF2 fold immunity protein [Desulfatibacillum aliphaticivorans]
MNIKQSERVSSFVRITILVAIVSVYSFLPGRNIQAETIQNLGHHRNIYEKLEKNGHIPEEGIVPDAETAIRIAEAVWLPIYGDSILEKKPFVAVLIGEDWFVYGTLPSPPKPTVAYFGGIPYIRIRKADGKILGVIHTK